MLPSTCWRSGRFPRICDVSRWLERDWWRRGRFLFRFRLDHCTHASLGISRRGGLLATAYDLKKLGCDFIRNVIATNVVVRFLEISPVEHLHFFNLAIVFDTLGKPVDILVVAFTLLPKARQITVSNTVLEAVGILLHDHAVAANHERA